MPQRYCLDTSALLVCFLTRATGHVWLRGVCDPASRNTTAIAMVTGTELAAALNQMVRGGRLRRKTCDQALIAFWRQVAASEYRIIPVTIALVRRGADLCGVHSLRGYDAIQLAAALTFRDDARLADAATVAAGGTPLGDPTLLTSDRQLADAATAEGFAVDTPLAHP